jgi:hypothetical protein
MKIYLQDIRNNFQGYERLTALAASLDACIFENIEIDLSRVRWLDANMCASLGAILYKAGRDLNNVTLTNPPPRIESILAKNGFLSNYGWPRQPDIHGTTIGYNRFEAKDDKYFALYLERQLIGRELPKMSAGLLKKFRESIFEIFSNAVLHSGTKHGIFSCGQFFPKRHCLDFSIADLGVGIRERVNHGTGQVMSSVDAIIWALASGNTTKSGSIPGGLGLKILQEFIRLNEGRMQIVSDTGYWELTANQIQTRFFASPFPGTVVTIEINTADTKSYCLTSELQPDSIF